MSEFGKWEPIGNVPLAAVPVIYTNVHFCAAVFTEK